MFARLSERVMHWTRWILTIGWLLLIASLFYDPWTVQLTVPDHPWSPLRLSGECVRVQGQCVPEAPYSLGATIFWGVVVPSGIFILLVFGHELWRRICPLSFLSQIPRALGWQRQFKRENQQTGKVRYELAKVKPDSWLGKNYLYVQLSWFFVGLCGRILFFNADRWVLGFWLLFTIAAAITVGYFYGGKSWCQYFCPMAPVQTVFSEPRGLLGTKAHMSEQPITQSMCRTALPNGEEKSACVACQSPCIDIDSERTYWDGVNSPKSQQLRYGYVGIVVGYFVYYYLYAGSWDYYFSGFWNRDPDQLSALMKPGLYLFGQAINIPKLVAVPLVLGSFAAIAYFLGVAIEKRILAYARQHHPNLTPEVIRHRIFTICTFVIFNFFFVFAARPLILLTPVWVQYIYNLGLVFLSTLWLNRTWKRTPDVYSRENLANRFRKQLEKLQLDLSQYLDTRTTAGSSVPTLDDLSTNEIYILAKVLPGFTREKRHEAYKGVVREALEEGFADTSSSLEVLRQLREELGVTDDEHREVLEELGVENPELLNPEHKRTLENQIRLSGYKKSLERLVSLQQGDRAGLNQLSPQESNEIRSLRREYVISSQEEEWILQRFSPEFENTQKIDQLIARLAELRDCRLALSQPLLESQHAAVSFLQDSIHFKQKWILSNILNLLEPLERSPKAVSIAERLHQLVPEILAELIESSSNSSNQVSSLENRLHPDIFSILSQPSIMALERLPEVSPQDTVSYLSVLLHHNNPLIQSVTLYLIAQIDANYAKKIASDHTHSSTHPLMKETAEQLVSGPKSSSLSQFPKLEKLIYLANSDLFHRVELETLTAISDRAIVKTYTVDDVISDAGDTCRELLLLIEGNVKIRHQLADKIWVEELQPGEMLDELEVLTRSNFDSTITANSEMTRILTIPVDVFDDLLDRYPDLVPRVLELESRYLKQLVNSK